MRGGMIYMAIECEPKLKAAMKEDKLEAALKDKTALEEKGELEAA